jgi:3-oxoacyl-[acyl-carrier-protein] synthase II
MAHWSSPVFRYALLVVDRALRQAGISVTPALAPRVAVTLSTAIGGLDAVINADRVLVRSGQLPLPYMNPNSCINMIGGKVAIMTGATGPCLTTVTACATGSTSMVMGGLLLAAGLADVVIAGAVDFPLVEPIVAGFATMGGAFRPKPGEPSDPTRASRPFSLHRRGFVISEGAACVVLTHPEFARAHGLRSSFELAGWAMTADAEHPVAPRRETIARCMRDAIADAGIGVDTVASVNAHATSTKVGDKAECDALHDVFGDSAPPVTANKSLLGHAMGASSAIETLLALEGMRSDTVFPTRNYVPDSEIELDVVAPEARKIPQEYVLKNAFGFGGTNTCLILRRVN